MLVIGLTGNVGTGKSTVAAMLAELGAATIDADKLGHELFQRRGAAYDEVVAAFGKAILTAGGEIDRQKLGQVVFQDAETRTRLNDIMHPRIYALVQEKLSRYQCQGKKVAVLEAALLTEANWGPLVNQVWVTVAPQDVVIARLTNSRGMNREEILDRIRSQMPAEEKVKGADVVIDTDCSLDELKARVSGLWKQLQATPDEAYS